MAWAAGLFEGEGTITYMTKSRRARLAVKMTDEEAVRRFESSIGVGKVYGPYGPYKSQLGNLPTWYWAADGNAAVEAADKLLPWLGSRCRERLQEVLSRENARRP